MFKRILCLSIAVVMVLSLAVVNTYAEGNDINNSGNSGTSVVTLDTSSKSFRVTVPSVLPIIVDSDNNVTVSNNSVIKNLSDGPVEVTNVSVEGMNGWSLVPFNTDFTKVPVDTKQYGMIMQGVDVTEGVPATAFDIIPGSGNLKVTYNGNVAIQSEAYNQLDIGHVVFTVAWNNGQRLDPNDITYAVENEYVAAYMSAPAYNKNDYSYSYMTEYINATGGAFGRPASGTLSAPEGATKITVTSQTDGKSFTKSISGDSVTVDSLIPGVEYNYQMFDSSNEVVKSGRIVPTGKVRMINAGANTQNIRDLGGWQADNGTLKYGLLYRGGGVDGSTLTADQKEYFKDFLGVEAELNLRGESEDPMTESHLGSDVDFINIAAGAYSMYNHHDGDGNGKAMTDSFRFILSELRAGKPVYFHCAAGADRTATIAFILEAICGVSQNDIDRDYELSCMLGRTRNGDETAYPQYAWKNMIATINEEFLGDTLRDKVINALLQKGITIEEINELRQLVIAGSPETLTVSTFSVFDKNNVSRKSRLNSSGSVVAHTATYGDGGEIAVTDFIPIGMNDIVTVVTDLPQSGNYHCQTCFYDEDYNYLGGMGTGSESGFWYWDSSRTTGKLRVSRFKYNKPAIANAKYIKICVGFVDIDNASVTIQRY